MTAARRSTRGFDFVRILCPVAALLFAATGCSAQHSGSGGLAGGMQLFSQHDLDGADAAFASLPPDTPTRDRASALQMRGLIAWRFRHDWELADTYLRQALELDAGRSGSWTAVARFETARGRYDAARDAALQALADAETREETVEGTVILARNAVATAEAMFDEAPESALDGVTVDWLRESHGRLEMAVRESPGELGLAALLVRTSIFLGEGDALLAAWQSYFLTIVGQPDAGVLEPARETLRRLLTGWHQRERTPSELGEIVLALARSGMHRDAWLAARTPGWTQGLTPIQPEPGADSDTPTLAETLSYAAFVRRAEALTNEHYRQLANDDGDTPAYRRAFLALAEPLWDALRWTRQRPQLTLPNLIQEVDRRFAAQLRGGSTAGFADLHFGHRVIDEEISVSQYGHDANLRFVSLDGMVSNGFQSWAWDFQTMHGGWASSGGITQVRPAYAGESQQIWRGLNDPTSLARMRERTAVETERDWERATENPYAFLPGLIGRLRLQGVDHLLRELRAEGTGPQDLQARFLVTSEAAAFASSIVAHEGRHAIDQRLGSSFSSADLEFRAKLSEVAFAPHPRLAFGGIISGTIGDGTPHGQANLRVMEGLVAWMSDHPDDIAGLDVSRPLLPQLDLLTDDQLKAAMASMDPLAR